MIVKPRGICTKLVYTSVKNFLPLFFKITLQITLKKACHFKVVIPIKNLFQSKYFLKRRNYLQFREKVEKEGFQYTDPESDKK